MENNAISELKKIPITEWAKIWCELNKWRIPDCLESIKPVWWDEEFSQNKNDKIMGLLFPIMTEIKRTIGEEACSREWNRDIMTDK